MCDFNWCMIDWDATGSMLQGWGAIFGAIAVAVTALVGTTTFAQWKTQKLTERKMHEAERIMATAYKANRALESVRSPASWGPEYQAAERRLRDRGEWDDAADQSDKDALKLSQIILTRISDAQSVVAELEECQPTALALFGDELEAALGEIKHQFHVVGVYARAYYRERNGNNQAFWTQVQSNIWSGYPSEDQNPMDRLIKQQMNIVKSVCLPILRDGNVD